MGQQFGDTTLTKVFVGGLAWETQKEALREHFQRYGEILEAVIISDKITGRSKGYGFVTFKEAEAAKKACEDATPMINGRRANCNLASLGAKRSGLRPSPPSTPAPLPPALTTPAWDGGGIKGLVAGGAVVLSPTSGTPPPPSPFQLQHYHGVVPFYATAAYGYSPNYVTDVGYNAKLSHSGGGGGGGGYFQGQFSYPAQGGMVAPHGMLPVYPLYHLQNQQGMGVPAHFFPPAGAATGAAMTTIPTIVSKPTVMPPPAKVEQVKGSS